MLTGKEISCFSPSSKQFCLFWFFSQNIRKHVFSQTADTPWESARELLSVPWPSEWQNNHPANPQTVTQRPGWSDEAETLLQSLSVFKKVDRSSVFELTYWLRAALIKISEFLDWHVNKLLAWLVSVQLHTHHLCVAASMDMQHTDLHFKWGSDILF